MDETEGFTGVVERAYNNETKNNYFVKYMYCNCKMIGTMMLHDLTDAG